MKPVSSADDGLTALRDLTAELQEWQSHALNEADTRCKIIDVLLLQVLGWDEASIVREERTASGRFLDYRVEGNSTSFVVEAKRSGSYFEMPRVATRRAAREGVLARSPDLKAALDQVVVYCREQGVAVGVVANGLQMAITLPFRDSANGHDTLLFDGLKEIERHFIEFWNLLSPQGRSLDTLRQQLRVSRAIRPAPQGAKVLRDHLVVHPDEPVDRNPVTGEIEPILRHYFEDIVSPDKRSILKRGYVESVRHTQYGRQVDELLSRAVPHLGVSVAKIESTRRVAPRLDSALTDLVSDLDDDRPEGAVSLIVGGVGAGKTTFLRRYFEYLESNELRNRVVPVFVDFLDVAEDSHEIGRAVDLAIQDELRANHPGFDLDSWETLQQVYRSEVTRLRKGLLKPLFESDQAAFGQRLSDEIADLVSDSEAHTGRLLRYLRTRFHKTVCLVLDNADQLPPLNQAEILRIAFQRARSWDVVVLLAIRGETFWQFRNQPPLDAYHRQALQVEPPRLAHVLSRRLELAKEERGERNISFETSLGTVTQVPVSDFLQVLVDSFLGRRDSQVRIFLEALAAGDVRHGLDLFTTFLRSGHTNMDEYFKRLVETGSYVVPLHHLIRGIAFGDYQFFNSSKSLIANVYSIEDDGFYSHFSKLRILRHLYHVRDIDSRAGKGYVAIEGLFRLFQSVIADEAGLRAALHPLLQQRLIEASNGHRIGGAEAEFVRITSGGQYYSEHLFKTFAYLDLVATDTPIRSREAFASLERIPVGFAKLEDRIRRVEQFVDYLGEEERNEGDLIQGLAVADDARVPIVEEIVASLSGEFPRIRRGMERYRG